MLQRAGVAVAAELHGSLWRLRCATHGAREDLASGAFATRACPSCGRMLRPDIIWFEDAVDEQVFEAAGKLIAGCELFVAVGTSAVVYPAASFIPLARRAGAFMVEKIGRASWRARVWQYVSISVVAGALNKNQQDKETQDTS